MLEPHLLTGLLVAVVMGGTLPSLLLLGQCDFSGFVLDFT